MKTKNIFTLILVASSFFVNAQQKQKMTKLPSEATTFLDENFKGIAIQEMYKETQKQQNKESESK